MRQARQAIRRARRENPQRQDRGHRLRRANRPRAASPPWTRSTTSSAIRKRPRLRTFPGLGCGDTERVKVNDIMSVKETAGHLIEGFGDRSPRLCADPEWLRPSVHLLHHSVRPRAVALGAGGRGGGAGAQARRERLCRDRADRRRYHRLRRGPSRRDHARQARRPRFSRWCRSSSGCGCPRSIRSRPTPRCSRPSPRRSG